MPSTPATAKPAAPAKPPEHTGGVVVPEGIARFLTLLRWIIGYGKTLADTFHQHAPDASLRRFVDSRFRTSDLNVVFARLRRGLLLALALEDRLVRRAAAGRDIVETPVRSPRPGTKRSGPPRKRGMVRRSNVIDLPLDRLPTAEEIADELRRRPVGAVLVDICRCLGILPGDLTHAQQDELLQLVTRYGGSMVVLLFKDLKARVRRLIAAELREAEPAPAATGAPANEAARPTGPPSVAQAA